MPEISRFLGIVVRMFWDDHAPPHSHVEYGDHRALVDIQSLSIFAGRLPPRVAGLVVEWATLHGRSCSMTGNERARNRLC